MAEPPLAPLPPRDQTHPLERVHLVGIGGAGMSGIARVLLARGASVSGSDAKQSRTLDALTALGARIHVGHAAENLGDAAVVVASTAIRADNPELVEAARRSLPVLPRAAALAALMAGSRGLAVAGTHGKTTTTSMLVRLLQRCGQDPSFAVGGDLNEAGSNAHQGSGPFFVAEADESDGSFLLLSPEVAVVTNVEADHLDHYGTTEAVAEAFRSFLGRLTAGGTLVTCADDPGAAALADPARALGLDVVTYGVADDADLRLDGLVVAGGGSAWQPVWRGRRLPTVRPSVPGRHNALNSAAALAVGLSLGLPPADMADGLASFRGVRRRFELVGTVNGVRVVDDYAHHPTEVAATLAAARSVAGGGRLVVAFQPHRYSRTAAFGAELGRALGAADVVVVMDVYAAGEDPVPGITGATVAGAVPLAESAVLYEPVWARVPGALARQARPGDLVLTLGAGDITQIGPEVLIRLSGTG